jgi:mannitol 2-dehydrogenase
MQTSIKLNAAHISALPESVGVPAYDRTNVKTGIVHVGIGGFHRAHQAFYTDELLQNHGHDDWGICGVALLKHDRKIYETLKGQDGLYTLLITEPDGTRTARVIGSIVEYLFAPDNPKAVIEKMASPDIRIITLTITEGGYNFNADTGDFQSVEPSIQHDLNNPDRPQTIFGYLTQALKLRKERGLPGLTIQSCDNIQHNGAVTKKMLLSYITLAAPGLTEWVLLNVSFPNSMVDRITPVTSPADIQSLQDDFSITDAWPVVCEPFCQWVIEDDFINGRPEWDSVGAQFVLDVTPYEKMKIRLLNGGHVALGFTGYLNGYEYVGETMDDQVFFDFVRGFMDEEAGPILEPVPGIDLESYKDTLMQRFRNPFIRDQLTRIFSESSAKIPKFLLPTINDQLKINGPIHRGALIIAAWCRYFELAEEKGYINEIQDELHAVLLEKAKESRAGDELSFLKIESIFGELATNKRFIKSYIPVLDGLRKYGIREMIKKLDEHKW